MPYTPTTVGVHAISANYSGDANYLPPGTSVTGTLTVIGPDFTLTLQPASANVNPGSSATYKIGVAGTNAFNSNVSVVCSIMATAATCTPGASNPASVVVGSSATITVTTTARGLVTPIDATPRFGPMRRLMPLGFLAVLTLVLLALGAQTRRQRLALSVPAVGFVLFLLLQTSGCGGGNGGNTGPPPPVGTPAGAYTVTITGTSGTTTHTATTTLVVN